MNPSIAMQSGGKRNILGTTNIYKPGLPLISIITVVFNGVKTIEKTIQSVINQTYENIEYIVVDGGSADGTLEVIKKYENHLDFWVSESDKGIYDAMNKGIRLAHGELIGIINADDWYENNIIKYIAECYNNIGYKAVIHGLLRNFLNEQFYSIKGNSISVLKYDMIQHPTCFIPKSIYQQYGAYDTKYIYSADYDLILRYVNSGIEFKLIERIIANFRLGGISSIPGAEKEMYKVQVKHHLISKAEYILRIILVQLVSFVKKFLK